MSLQAELDKLTQATDTPPPIDRPKAKPAQGRQWEWDGGKGFLVTEPLAERPRTWDKFIRDAGLDPEEVEVIEPVQVRGWDSPIGKGQVHRMHYYRLTLQRRTIKRDLDELIRDARKRARGKPATPLEQPAEAFVLALGDLQLGKVDGDGAEGTIARFIAATDAAVARYKRIAKGAPVYVFHLGDCIEGFQSQGGANAWRTTLTTTEQVRVYRRLLMLQVKAFAAVAPEVTVIGVPGNHDEAHRPLHTYGDSWAIDAVAAVSEALAFAGGYEHVRLLTPERDELTATVDVCGTVVGAAHGHQWRAGQAPQWWAKQAHGRQPVGHADLLLSAHLHHLRVEHTGSDKTWLQVPALESGSQWWKHRTGEWGQPGVVTLMVGGGAWRALEVL